MTHARSGRIGVIGGGLGGLAAACTLAARGYEVVLFEKNAWLGGKAAVLRGRRLPLRHGADDPADAVGAAADLRRGRPRPRRRARPDPARPAVAVLLRRRLDARPARRPPRGWRATLDAFAPGGTAGQGYRQLPRPLRAAPRHLASGTSSGGRSARSATCSTLDTAVQPVDARRRAARCGPGAPSAATIRSLRRATRASRRCSTTSRSTSARRPTSRRPCCAASPTCRRARASGIPRGGTRAVAEALVRLAGELGVELRTGVGDSRRSHRAPTARCRGSRLDDGERVPLAAVVSNCDAVRTHRELLAGHPAARRFERRRGYEPACSGVVLYLGLDRRYDHLLHHNFVFSRDPHEEFDCIYRKGEPAPDPTCYVCAPARTEPDVAPPGGEALYVLVHTPYLRPHHDWGAIYPRYRQTILDKLARTAGLDDLEGRIRVERRLTPQDIHDRYRVLEWCDLRPGEPRPAQRCVQAGEPQPGRRRALPGRRRGPSGAGDADGADVGLDRGRYARSRRHEATGGSGRRLRASGRGPACRTDREMTRSPGDRRDSSGSFAGTPGATSPGTSMRSAFRATARYRNCPSARSSLWRTTPRGGIP